MAGFMDAFRQGRDEARAARGAPPRGQPNAGPDRTPDQPTADAEEVPRGGELETALRERDAELADTKRLLTETTDYAEQLQTRANELFAGVELMAKVLRLRGVKTFLLQRFHPDKYPGADDKQREQFTEASKTISAAYAFAAQLQTSE